MNHQDYLEAGFRIFGLHGLDNTGHCACGNRDCKALLKHPRTSNWQYTPHWSDEQLDNMEAAGFFKVGFGICVDDHLIIDIDPRNGGEQSYEKLCKDTGWDFKADAAFVVRTGGGGWHLYYKRPKGKALTQHLEDYPGIDFKSSGYVVGCGSAHVSGAAYEREKGHPQDIAEAPQKLLEMLEKKAHTRAEYAGEFIDLAESDFKEMLSYISPDLDYDSWIKVGMALHHATHGDGFDLWDNWSAGSQNKKYPGPDQLDRHWHSFGKCANPVTIGTLIHIAEGAGYQAPVTFETDLTYEWGKADAHDDIDLLRPPGFVGQLTQWVNDQCRYPREHLAVAAALYTMGNLAGLRYKDEQYQITPNQFIFCVAGSGTGKESILQAVSEIHASVGAIDAEHGAIKSEQEIVRNLIHHQAAYYILDEMGEILRKIDNAIARGGASYLEGTLGILMSAYSKANSSLKLGGDLRRETEKQLLRELKRLEKQKHDGEGVDQFLGSVKRQIQDIKGGLKNPFISLIGFSAPHTFERLVDYEKCTNGFFNRAMIVQERETNPKAKKNFTPRKMDMSMRMTLSTIFNGSTLVASPRRRIEYTGNKSPIPVDAEALKLLGHIGDEFYQMAEDSKTTLLESIPRRGLELVLKISFILGVPGGVRTAEHVRWAYAYVKRNIESKINLAAANMAEADKRVEEAIARKIMNLLSPDDGMTTGVLINRCRPSKKLDVKKCIDKLSAKGYIYKKTDTSEKKRGPKSEKWFLKE